MDVTAPRFMPSEGSFVFEFDRYVAMTMEGVCWVCEGDQKVTESGWGFCRPCKRGYRVRDDRVIERIDMRWTTGAMRSLDLLDTFFLEEGPEWVEYLAPVDGESYLAFEFTWTMDGKSVSHRALPIERRVTEGEAT